MGVSFPGAALLNVDPDSSAVYHFVVSFEAKFP